MSIICEVVTTKACGLVKDVYVKELVKQGEKNVIQETNKTYVLGLRTKSTTETRQPSLKDSLTRSYLGV